MKNIIITRHKGLIEWLSQEKGISGDIYDHLNESDLREIKNSNIYGVFPVTIIIKLLENNNNVFLVSLNIPSNLRGKEISIEKMKELGVSIIEIKNIDYKIIS